MRLSGNGDYRHDSAACDGVLLVNLGTPAAPTAKAVRRWLKEFLADPRVVELPRPVWWLILHLFILPLRPLRLAGLYQSIWHEEGSPLLVHSQRMLTALRQRLGAQPKLLVKIAMSYGEPSISSALSAMQKHPVRRLLALPLYPQYSSTTSASVFDAISRTLRTWRWLPELRFVSGYHNESCYLDACAQHIRRARSMRPTNGTNDRLLLFSFHGLPRANFLKGDPYHCQCQATARLIAERLGLGEQQWRIAFQSRFGRSEWLQPYTDETLRRLARGKAKMVDVFCPGFAADCLETLEEIQIQNRQNFMDAGGQSYHYIPALNDSEEHVQCLLSLIRKHSGGWDNFGKTATTKEQSRDRKRRAMRLGAKQ